MRGQELQLVGAAVVALGGLIAAYGTYVKDREAKIDPARGSLVVTGNHNMVDFSRGKTIINNGVAPRPTGTLTLEVVDRVRWSAAVFPSPAATGSKLAF